jgi:SAM-dependent methyltransferase
MPTGEVLSRDFYANLGAEGLRQRSRPEWDAAITELTAGYVGQRERLLDVGCGYGRIAIPLAARGYQVTGLDLSESLLRIGRKEARDQGERLPLAAGSMTRLPFSDESFDSVICLWSAFYEVLDPAGQVQALADMWRVLSEGGLALIEGPLPPGTDDELPTDRISRDVVQGLPNPHYIHDADTLSNRCTEAGISGAEIFIRDWAGRDRMLLIFQRPS